MIIGDKVEVIAQIDNQGYVGTVVDIIKNSSGSFIRVIFEVQCPVCECTKDTWRTYRDSDVMPITEEEYNTKISNNVINMEDYNK